MDCAHCLLRSSDTALDSRGVRECKGPNDSWSVDFSVICRVASVRLRFASGRFEPPLCKGWFCFTILFQQKGTVPVSDSSGSSATVPIPLESGFWLCKRWESEERTTSMMGLQHTSYRTLWAVTFLSVSNRLLRVVLIQPSRQVLLQARASKWFH